MVVGHYAGSCYSWDVVNEAVNENGTFRESVFFTTLGKDYIPLSFRAAARADPNAKLYYNDFNLEYNGNKTRAALDIVRQVQAAGERIDGVGFQAHMTVGTTPTRQQMATVLRRFTDLGVEVALTELDVRFSRLPANGSVLAQQSADYVSMVGACVDVRECVGVVVWQFTDKYSWIPTTFPGEGDACLFDAQMNRKPAYTAVANMLASATSQGAATETGGRGGRGGSNTGAAGPSQTGSSDQSISAAGRLASSGVALFATLVMLAVW
jgi:endo-1,4-beta-xylanase